MAQNTHRAPHLKQGSEKSGTGNLKGIESWELQRPKKSKKAQDADDAAAAFIKRVLCNKNAFTAPDRGSPKPLDELLPPLTSSNDIDLQLYALVAVIINHFVLSWYTRITVDEQFVEGIVHVVAHCTRGLEQRLRETDIETLMLDEIPALLDEHITGEQSHNKSLVSPSLTRRTAHRIARQTEVSTLEQSQARVTYHLLRPHVALSPVPTDDLTGEQQQANESTWRQLLVHGVLALLLPPEDLENPCLRILVAEVFSEMILGTGVSGKACEGWLLWEGVTKIIEHYKRTLTQHEEAILEKLMPNRLEQFGLLSSGPEPALAAKKSGTTRWREQFGTILWISIHYIVIGITMGCTFATAVAHASSALPRSSHSSKVPLSDRNSGSGLESKISGVGSTRPIVSMAIWPCASHLLALDQRMPWFTGIVSLLQWLSLNGLGQVCRTDSTLDR